jgi:hypothetical protein
MNWRIVIVALAGGLAVAIAELIFRRKPRTVGYWATVVVTTGILNSVATNLILPQVEVYQAVRDTPSIALLEKLDPAAGAEVKRLLAEAVRAGRADRARAEMRHALATVLIKHTPKAGDAEALALVKVTVDEAEVLRAKSGPAACHAFFFPRPGQFSDYSKIFDKQLLARDLAALEATLRSVIERPQPVPTEAEVAAPLQSVIARLQKRGVDLEVLNNDPRADPSAVCDTTLALYREIFALPVAQQGPLIRYLLSAE